MEKSSSKLNILVVCGGNTCRSPMAKIILEQKLKAAGRLDEFEVDSAAYDGPTYQHAAEQAREVIKSLYGKDLLESHQAKRLTPDLIQQADLILVMSARMKKGLSPEKTYTLMEAAGSQGDVADPFGGDNKVYLTTAREISAVMEKIVFKLTKIR